MTPDVEIDVPAEWTECPGEKQHERAVVEYRRETADGTTFLVSVFRRTVDTEEYLLHVSTIDPASTPDRHDYPVESYESREKAIEAAESFLDFFSSRLRDGLVSSADPDIDEIQDAIGEFTGPRFFPSMRHLIRRFR